jgi:hypothetical protein
MRAPTVTASSSDYWPTPERSAMVEVLKPLIDRGPHQRPHEVVDVITKHASQLTQQEADGVRDYVDVRLSEATRTLSFSGYAPGVDNGGWRSIGGIEKHLELEDFGAETEIERIHAKFGQKMRAVADALVEAVKEPRRPCPFERAIDRHFAGTKTIAMLERIATATIDG